MSEKKFVYANIRVPIELKGGSYEICSDYMNIEFELCPELPEKTTSDNQALIQKIFSIHPSSMVQEEISKVFSTDFGGKKPKLRQNSSFKKKPNRTQQYTRRTYE